MILLAALSLLIVLWPWLVYPLVLHALRRLRGPLAEAMPHAIPPTVHVIVPVYNGAGRIAAKLANLRAQTGFGEHMHILVVSDGSTDDTEARVQAAGLPNVTLIRTGERVGKTEAENRALATLGDGIVVFTDAATEFAPDTVARLVERLADPRVGCVSTEDRIVAGGDQGEQEGLYVRFEMAVRRLESDLGLLTGMSGSGYACRRELAEAIPPALTRDLYVPLRARELGLLSVCEPRALCRIGAGGTPRAELRRKLRTFVNGIDTVAHMRGLLSPTHGGLFAFALWSHKIVRWLGGLGMLGFLVASAALASGSALWAGLLLLQLAGYAHAALHWWLDRSPLGGPVESVSFFVLTQWVAALGWWVHLRGQHQVVWEPTRR